ncbi:histidine kinase [Limibacter armeniacum]|uniref:sensor histidine kinase n=1 Tax=Limibacter armeniacum TaxID=466084 RepID=UPI002FE5B915
MIDFLNIKERKLLKVGGIVTVGFLIQFVIDLIFRLQYRYYTLIDFGRIKDYMITTLYVTILIICIGKINEWVSTRFSWKESSNQRLLMQFLITMLCVIIVNTSIRFLMGYGNRLLLLHEEVIINIVVMGVFFVGMMLDWGVDLLNKYRTSLAEIEKFEKENIEFKLEMLKTQVNPHFLFNSLNVLSSLIYADQDTASQYVRKLANLYRYMLDSHTKQITTLEEELKMLEAYIYLMTLRFRENLIIEQRIDTQYSGYYIAPMTLQLLIENAVKHNVVSRKKPLIIEIYTTDEKNIVVRNNLQVKSVSEGESTKLGLGNINSRYQFISDRKIEIIKTEAYFTVTIPLLTN